MFKNSTSARLGNQINLGIAGMVFGRDHLALYFSRNQGTDGSGKSGMQYGGQYKLWF